MNCAINLCVHTVIAIPTDLISQVLLDEDTSTISFTNHFQSRYESLPAHLHAQLIPEPEHRVNIIYIMQYRRKGQGQLE